MHQNSLDLMRLFSDSYLKDHATTELEILDFGSQVVDGDPRSYQQLFARSPWNYRGLDISAGSNVDIVVADPYIWQEVPSDSVDLLLSGQTFEHVPYFWALAFELGRIVKPGGIVCAIAPSGGHEHRYPLDCWRFYPDGFSSLARWIGFELLDVVTDWEPYWGDSVLVMRKPIWDLEQRRAFAERWQRQMGLIPEPMSEPTSVSFEDAVSPSLLATVPGGGLNRSFANFHSATSVGRHRMQRSLLSLLSPTSIRRIVEQRNSIRSRT